MLVVMSVRSRPVRKQIEYESDTTSNHAAAVYAMYHAAVLKFERRMKNLSVSIDVATNCDITYEITIPC